MGIEEKNKSGFFVRFVKAVLPVLIVLLGAGFGVYLIKTRPVAQKRAPQTSVTRVDVMTAHREVNSVIIPAMGTVKPSRTVDLSSQVSGKIMEASDEFVPGGRFKSGQKILQIDPADYKLLVEQRESELQTAQTDFRLEQGQQAIAMHGYKLLGETFSDEDEEFVLRKPQLTSKEAAVKAAKARLEQAAIDLNRTTVTAPFNCMIQERFVDAGSSVNVGGKLASIIGIDEYWIELSVPMDELKWLVIPYSQNIEGSNVKVFLPGSNGTVMYRVGKITGLRADLEESSRMARVLVSVKDPLATEVEGKTVVPLLIGSFVEVEIEGVAVENSVKLPRKALRDGNVVWIHGTDGKLIIRQVHPVYKDNEYVYFNEGIEEGEQVITSDIAIPIESMNLAIADRSGL